MTTTFAAPSFDCSRFMDIYEFASFADVYAEDIYESVVNGGSLHMQPWMTLSDGPEPVDEDFAAHHAESQNDIFFRRDDLSKYLERRAAEAAVKAERASGAAEYSRYTTRLAYVGVTDRGNRDEPDHSHPVFSATGKPAFHKFSYPAHVEDYVVYGETSDFGNLPHWREAPVEEDKRRAIYESFRRGRQAA